MWVIKKLVIIGGGAAGLMAAASAENAQIIIVEKNSKPARKVMITGKGRCNVTNNSDNDTLLTNTPRNGRFLYSAFAEWGTSDTINFFEKLGVPLKTERGNRVFPVSDKSVDIVDALVKAAKQNGAKFVYNNADCVLCDNGVVKGVKLKNGDIINADSVIIATGGLSYPTTGSTGDGYTMAKMLGHTVTDLYPSLVSLYIHEGFCNELAGLSLKNVTLSLYENGKKKPLYSELGEMLFTHFGISGPLTLSASAHIKDIKNYKYKVVIDLKPALTLEQLDKRVLRDFSEESNKDFSNALGKLLPKSLIPVIVRLSKIDPKTKVNQISKEERSNLCNLIKNLELHITDFAPIDGAVITRGGVSVKEINPSTMESRLIDNLYFAGEVIDVDAYTGGFNLQIAFSTGHLAGKNSCKEKDVYYD